MRLELFMTFPGLSSRQWKYLHFELGLCNISLRA